VRPLSSIGKRKGKRKALHIQGEIRSISGEGPYYVEIEKSRVGGFLCSVESAKRGKLGNVWITIAPLKDENVKRESSEFMTLTNIKTRGEREIVAVFESDKGRYSKAEVILDNRGRAKKLEVGGEYSFSILKPREYFDAYERKSVPSGARGKSEPEEFGRRRMELIKKFSSSAAPCLVLDTATGLKDYLKNLSLNGCKIICLNFSNRILERTRKWMNSDNAHFVKYDADTGFPLKTGFFDLVIVDALLEYTKKPTEVLQQCSTLLKEGGSLILLEPVESQNSPEFYPQDLWEIALWRPIVDNTFATGVKWLGPLVVV
jgi:SAM-dependent methyltransferase